MRRIQIIFGIIGGVTLITGLMMIAATAVAVPSSAHPPNIFRAEAAVYVGSGTCFTCHSAQHGDWSETLHPIIIQDGVSSPSAVSAADSTGETVRQVEMGGATRAYTSADVTVTMDSSYRQRYIMQTDSGSMLLPAQWNSASATWVTAYQGDLSAVLLDVWRS